MTTTELAVAGDGTAYVPEGVDTTVVVAGWAGIVV